MEENNSKKLNPMLIVGAVVVLVILGVVVVMGMGGNENDPETASNNESETMLAGDENANFDEDMIGGDAMPGETVIEVEGGSFYFEPNEIRAKVGEPITITLNSVDMMHDLVIDEFSVGTEVLPAGESGSITFTPTQAGEFEFYCSVGEHRANGMVGTLIVEE